MPIQTLKPNWIQSPQISQHRVLNAARYWLSLKVPFITGIIGGLGIYFRLLRGSSSSDKRSVMSESFSRIPRS